MKISHAINNGSTLILQIDDAKITICKWHTITASLSEHSLYTIERHFVQGLEHDVEEYSINETVLQYLIKNNLVSKGEYPVLFEFLSSLGEMFKYFLKVL